MSNAMTFFSEQVARVCDADLRGYGRATAFMADKISVHWIAKAYAVHATRAVCEASMAKTARYGEKAL